MRLKNIFILLTTMLLLFGCSQQAPPEATTTPSDTATASPTPVVSETPLEAATPAVEGEPSGPLVEMLPGKKWTVVNEDGSRAAAVDFVIEADFTADLKNNMTALYVPQGDQLIEKVTYNIPQKYYVNTTYKVEVVSPTEFKATDIAIDSNMGLQPRNATTTFKVVE